MLRLTNNKYMQQSTAPLNAVPPRRVLPRSAASRPFFPCPLHPSLHLPPSCTKPSSTNQDSHCHSPRRLSFAQKSCPRSSGRLSPSLSRAPITSRHKACRSFTTRDDWLGISALSRIASRIALFAVAVPYHSLHQATMSVVTLLGVKVVNNPAKFTDKYEFEITFECLEALEKGSLSPPSSLS